MSATLEKKPRSSARPGAGSVRPHADFEPARYRASLADMFGLLDRKSQAELVENLSVLPRHIHRMANEGLIAAPTLTRTNPRRAPDKPARRLG